LATVRRRQTAEDTEPVSRRRDRAAEVEPDDDDAVEVEVTSRPPRSRRSAEPEPGGEEDDLDELDPEPAPKAKRRVEPEPEDDEPEPPRAKRRVAPEPEEDEEPPAPRAKRRAAPEPDDDDDEPPARKSSKAKKKGALPPGIRTGASGVDEVRAMGGKGANRLKLGSQPELIKFLEAEPFVTYRQHWVPQGGGQGNRPFTCIGVANDCPLCDLGDRNGQAICLNVLHLSAADAPENKLLQLGITAWNALKEVATSKKTGQLNLEAGYYTVSRSGKDQQSQTNFRPLKWRDIEEDWDELEERFDFADIDILIEEAKESVYEPLDVVQISTFKQLEEQAAYLSED
jgi:hypothetical protein